MMMSHAANWSWIRSDKIYNLDSRRNFEYILTGKIEPIYSSAMFAAYIKDQFSSNNKDRKMEYNVINAEELGIYFR